MRTRASFQDGFGIAFFPEPQFLLLGADDALAAELLVVGDLTVGEFAVLLDQDGDGHGGNAHRQEKEGQEEGCHRAVVLRFV